MTAHAEVAMPQPDAVAVHGTSGHEARGTDTALMGMLLFIASEVMFFAALFGAYFNVKATAAIWPPEGTDFITPLGPVLVGTVLLVISSFTMQWGVGQIRKGNRTALNRAVAVTVLLGIAFLLIQVYDYYEFVTTENFGINSGVYGTLFYTM